MPRMKIKNTNRTKEEVLSLLKSELEPLYEVSEKTMMLGSDILVKKNAFSGVFVSVNVNIDKGITTIGYEKNAPNLLLRGPAAKLLGNGQIAKDLKNVIDKLS